MKTIVILFYILFAITMAAVVLFASMQGVDPKTVKPIKRVGAVVLAIVVGVLFPLILEVLGLVSLKRYVDDWKEFMDDKREEIDKRIEETEKDEDE